MWTGSDPRLGQLVAGSHEVFARVEVCDLLGTVIDTLEVTDGQVTVDSNAAVRRTTGLTIAPKSIYVPKAAEDLLAPYARLLNVYRGARGYVGTSYVSAEVPMGVFVLQTVELEEDDGGLSISISGQDLSFLVSRAKWIGNRQVPLNGAETVDAAVAIREVVVDRYPSAVIDIPDAMGDCSLQWFEGGESSDPWTDVLKYANDKGSDLRFDPDGVLRVGVIPDPFDEIGLSPVVAYGPDALRVLTQVSRQLSIETMVNGVICTSESVVNDIPYRAEIWDTDPSSPTNVDTIGMVPAWITSATALSDGDCLTAAVSELNRRKGASENVSWDQVADPRLDVFDIIGIENEATGTSLNAVLDSFTISLGEATMAGKARARSW